MSKEILAFNAFETPLLSGVNLIEASAGTGKTYSIAMLVARFVVEKGTSIENILVVTFTKAATAELKERIRARLLDVRKTLAGEHVEDTLTAWVATLEDRAQAQARINNAIAEMDYASIFTIHGFAQRVLKRNALESGQLFDVELQENITEIKQHIAEDFWRIHTYECSVEQAQLFQRAALDPTELLRKIADIPEGARVQPDAPELAFSLQRIPECIARVEGLEASFLEPMLQFFEDEPGIFLKAGSALKAALEQLRENQQKHTSYDLQAIVQCTSTKIQACLKKNSRKKALEQFAKANINLHLFDDKAAAIEAVDFSILHAFHQYMQTQLKERLLKSNVMSFDQMIERLASVIDDEEQAHLRRTLSEQYPVALIDEFQDTDHAQWTIFRRLFADTRQHLYLIGDPKQAIYHFRGADINTYLEAQKTADRQYNLAKNWRSHKYLISAVNHLFGESDNPFLVEGIAYHEVAAAIDDDRLIDANGASLHQFCFWQLPEAKWTIPTITDEFQTNIVSEILALVNQENYIGAADERRRVLPSDIAILVSSNNDALSYQSVLRKAGLPSVVNGSGSVFGSPQARELYYLLLAVVSPTNLQYAKNALTISWFGIGIEEYVSQYRDGNGLDDWIMHLQTMHEHWRYNGVMSMVSRVIEENEVSKHLAVYSDVERRMTNIQHILELLQQQILEEKLGMTQCLQWLSEQISQAEGDKSQEREMRLESDEQAIKISTIHASKGLEYAIVFCPTLWKTVGLFNGTQAYTAYMNDELVCDLGSADKEAVKQKMLQETREEKMRLLYVALTRAKYRCYVMYVDQKSSDVKLPSTINHLLDAYAGESYAERLQAYSAKDEQGIQYRLLELEQSLEGTYQTPISDEELSKRDPKQIMKTNWIMSSYSSLASHEYVANMPEIPLDKADEQEVSVPEIVVDELPRGSHTGNVIHELLENFSFQQIAQENFDEEYLKQRESLCTKYSLSLDEPNPELINALLVNTVTSPLSADGAFTLAALQDRQCLKEMPFYFKVQDLDTRRLNQVLVNSPAYQALTAKEMTGQLNGFIDLICEFQGRYYVMDYKTNALESYDTQSMTAAMHEHNYGLQYWLYSLVLHRHLEHHLPDYRFEKHFGGVRYLFVRGMFPDQPMQGVFEDMPKLETLEALAAVFEGGVAA